MSLPGNDGGKDAKAIFSKLETVIRKFSRDKLECEHKISELKKDLDGKDVQLDEEKKLIQELTLNKERVEAEHQLQAKDCQALQKRLLGIQRKVKMAVQTTESYNNLLLDMQSRVDLCNNTNSQIKRYHLLLYNRLQESKQVHAQELQKLLETIGQKDDAYLSLTQLNEASLNDLSCQLQESKGEGEALQLILKQKEEEISGATIRLNKMAQDLENLKKSSEESHNVLLDEKKTREVIHSIELQTIVDEKESLRIKFGEKEKSLNEIQKALDDAMQSFQVAQSTHEKIQKELSDTNTELTEAKNSAEAELRLKIAANVVDKENAQSELCWKEEEVDNLKILLGNQSEELSSMKNRLENANTLLQEKKSEEVERIFELGAISAENENLRKKIDAIEQTLENTKKDLEVVTNKFEDSIREYKVLQEEQNTSNILLVEARDKRESELRSKLDEMTSSKTEFQRKLNEKEDELNEAKLLCSALTEEVSVTQSRWKESYKIFQEDTIARELELTSQIRANQSENERLQITVHEQCRNLEDVKKSLEESHCKIEHLQRTYELSMKELENSKTLLAETKEMKEAELRHELDDLGHKMSDTAELLKRAEDALTESKASWNLAVQELGNLKETSEMTYKALLEEKQAQQANHMQEAQAAKDEKESILITFYEKDKAVEDLQKELDETRKKSTETEKELNDFNTLLMESKNKLEVEFRLKLEDAIEARDEALRKVEILQIEARSARSTSLRSLPTVNTQPNLSGIKLPDQQKDIYSFTANSSEEDFPISNNSKVYGTITHAIPSEFEAATPLRKRSILAATAASIEKKNKILEEPRPVTSAGQMSQPPTPVGNRFFRHSKPVQTPSRRGGSKRK